MITIYIITNKHNGKQYIGQTNDLKRRMGQHRNDKRRIGKCAISTAIKKYGRDNFEIKPLCIVEDYMADETEQKCIASYGTLAPNGYNLMTGGQANRGSITEQTRAKLSEAKKGKPSPKKGRTLSEETRRKISKSLTGKKLSEEAKRKMSEAHKGGTKAPFTEEHKHNLSLSLIGHRHTEESKRKISEAKKGRPSPTKGRTMSEETRRKMSEARKGKKRPPFSDEHKTKISEAHKKRLAEINKEGVF